MGALVLLVVVGANELVGLRVEGAIVGPVVVFTTGAGTGVNPAGLVVVISLVVLSLPGTTMALSVSDARISNNSWFPDKVVGEDVGGLEPGGVVGAGVHGIMAMVGALVAPPSPSLLLDCPIKEAFS